MLKWLEEVKLCDPNHPDGAAALVDGFMKTSGYGRAGAELLLVMFQTAWASWEVNRLIAIAVGSEFEGWHNEAEDNCCPICGGFGIHMDGSDNFASQEPCPYSDEYKGG